MLKREIAALYDRKDKLQTYGNQEVIDLKLIENKEN
jgi:hypothetical protein